MYIEIENYPNYSINEFGDVKNNKTGKILKQFEKTSRNSGYMCVYLYNKDGRKTFFVHRLVALMFIPNPNKLPQVNHKDENTHNNYVKNLEWCTSKYNNNYGTKKERLSKLFSGESNPNYGKILSEEVKQKIRKAKIGTVLTEEHKRKISESNKGNGRPGKLVYCIELNKTFKSTMEVEREFGIPNTNVSQVCLGKRKTAGGYHWSYIKEE